MQTRRVDLEAERHTPPPPGHSKGAAGSELELTNWTSHPLMGPPPVNDMSASFEINHA